MGRDFEHVATYNCLQLQVQDFCCYAYAICHDLHVYS